MEKIMKKDDTISRQRAIDAFDCSVGGVPVESVKYVSEYADKMMSRIKALPSAQPERKKGKWVNCYTDGFGNMCKCSECGAMIDIQEKSRSFFCYHCGADMREDVLPHAQPTQCNSSNVLRYPQCTSRTKLGNCDPVGGFCTSVPKEMCDTQEHEKENITDTISRQAAMDALMEFDKKLRKINWHRYPYTEHECRGVDKAIVKIANLPSAQPYTDEEIQVMQDLEQAQLDKAYELGWKEGREAFRQAAIEAINIHLNKTDVPASYPGIITALEEWLNNLPSAQPEIVRCKDCKYGDTFHEFDDPEMPMKCIGHHYGGTYPDDFCSFAERRTDG